MKSLPSSPTHSTIMTTHQHRCDPKQPGSLRSLAAVLLAMLLTGCGRLQPRPLIDPDTLIPEQKVVAIFADGINHQVFNTMLANGELPNIDRYLVRRGTTVKNAITCTPSITYAVTTSFLTGLSPSRHTILGNRYFDRHRRFIADYNTIATYRSTENHFTAETIFERLDEAFTVTIQLPIRRGVHRNIDNWASSGIRWYFGQITEIDALTAERFHLIGQLAREARRWPDLIFAYMPATDEMGHRYGPNSQRYHESLVNVDEQVGRIARALQASQLLASTTLLFFSDHGMAGHPHQRYLDLADWLATHLDITPLQQGPGPTTAYTDRLAFYAEHDAVLIQGGNRRAMLYLRGDRDWSSHPPASRIRSIAAAMAAEPAVQLIAWPEQDHVMITNHLGTARLTATGPADAPLNERLFHYLVVDGRDPLGYAEHSRTADWVQGDPHTGEQWLIATAETEAPGLVANLAELFESQRAGDLMVFAAEGWDFAGKTKGGHGGITREEMVVPMILAGPGIPEHHTIPTARTVDIAPTILHRLGHEPDEYRFDGRSLITDLEARQ